MAKKKTSSEVPRPTKPAAAEPAQEQTTPPKPQEQRSEAMALAKFVKVWSGDRGAFYPGMEAQLPAAIVRSLKAEGVVE